MMFPRNALILLGPINIDELRLRFRERRFPFQGGE